MLLVIPIFALCGCAALQPAVSRTSAPDKANGYVAGAFTKARTSGSYALILRNMDTGDKITISMGEDTIFQKNLTDQVVSYAVPPGTYSVSDWAVYDALTTQIETEGEITNKYLSSPFTVKAGAVTFIGRFDMTSTFSSSYSPGGTTNTYHFSFKPSPIRFAEAHVAFVSAYPEFSLVPFSCHLCVDNFRPRAAR